VRPALADERGVSLAESVVTMLILGVVLAMFFTVLTTMQTAAARQDGRVRRNDEARLALAQLDREIRSGNVLYDPSTESDVDGDIEPNMSLRIYTQADAPSRGYQCAQWRVTDGTMQARWWDKDDPEATVTEWWTVARNVVNRSVSPPVPAFELDSTAAYGKRNMSIRLLIDDPTDHGEPMEVAMSITGRNTQYFLTQSNVCTVVPGY
jgi:type II secretory pathway component PulJ